MESIIEWNNELCVGIDEIDEQHKVLVGLLNKLYRETIIQKGGFIVVNGILKELVQYTIIHFAVEESLFRIFDYHSYESHKKQHDNLKKDVIDIYGRVKRGEDAVNIELLMFLRKWLQTHILKDDKQSSAFLLEKGLKGSWSKRSWVGKIWDSMHHK